MTFFTSKFGGLDQNGPQAKVCPVLVLCVYSVVCVVCKYTLITVVWQYIIIKVLLYPQDLKGTVQQVPYCSSQLNKVHYHYWVIAE